MATLGPDGDVNMSDAELFRQLQHQADLNQMLREENSALRSRMEQTTPLSPSATVGNEQTLEAIVKTLATHLQTAATSMQSSNLHNTVTQFQGNPRHYRTWIGQLQKYFNMNDLTDAQKRMAAYQTCEDSVSDFVGRYLQDNPRNVWEDLQRELAVRFSEVTDPRAAMTMLKRVRQNPGEDLHTFAERVQKLSEQASMGVDQRANQLFVVDAFVDGLSNEQFKFKILRDQPRTLKDALHLITIENNLKQRVALTCGADGRRPAETRQVTPMDTSHFRGLYCTKCRRRGHVSRDCRDFGYKGNPPTPIYAGPAGSRVPGSNIVCWACGRQGHYGENCYAQTEYRQGAQRNKGAGNFNTGRGRGIYGRQGDSGRPQYQRSTGARQGGRQGN